MQKNSFTSSPAETFRQEDTVKNKNVFTRRTFDRSERRARHEAEPAPGPSLSSDIIWCSDTNQNFLFVQLTGAKPSGTVTGPTAATTGVVLGKVAGLWNILAQAEGLLQNVIPLFHTLLPLRWIGAVSAALPVFWL